MKWLLAEVRRLEAENESLLKENKELREEVTLVRLHDEFEPEEVQSPDLEEAPHPSAVPDEAVAFFRKLPDRLNFADYFQYAETERIAGDQAREYMLMFFREEMLEQRGRQIQKRREVRRPAPTT